MAVDFRTHEALCGGGVRHGFFGRRGGVSTGLYESLNCGVGSGDDPASVRENRARVAAALGADRLVTLHQVHSADCVIVREPWAPEDRPRADALVTDVPGLLIGVLTADCAPVLFSAQTADGRTIVGAAHAGWGGAVRGVLEATVARMSDLGAEPARIKAVIGPCIGPRSYEVSQDFIAPFTAQDDGNIKFFTAAERTGHLMFDLPAYVAQRLRRSGVGAVATIGDDTYAGEGEYFSFRRTTHRQESDYGRQVSALCVC